VAAASEDPTPGLCIEDQQFRASLGNAETEQRMAAFMAAGGQTREVELRGLPIGPDGP
jgi:hypothetical protein